MLVNHDRSSISSKISPTWKETLQISLTNCCHRSSYNFDNKFYEVFRMVQIVLSSHQWYYENHPMSIHHYDVIKWRHFPCYWPFVRGIHRSSVNSPHKGQWRGALVFSLVCARINGWVNNHEAGDLRRYRGHYDVTVMENRLISSIVGDCPLWHVGEVIKFFKL